jgi:hypothetical protein
MNDSPEHNDDDETATPERLSRDLTGNQLGDDASHAPRPEDPSAVNAELTPDEHKVSVDAEPPCDGCGASERACEVKVDCSGRRCCGDCTHFTPRGW